MNAIIGDNGIITRAQEANVQSSIANLEEFLQLKYTENYEEMAGYQSKIEGLMNECSSYFYIPANEGVGGLKYVIDSDGHALYLIKKSGLPEEIKESLVGGDAGEGKYADYLGLNDVYGVTSNLKVYYCSSGVDSIKGLAKENLDEEDLEKVVFEENSEMSQFLNGYDNNKDGKLNLKELKSVSQLVIDSSSGISSLGDLYCLTNLQKLTLSEITLNSLKGIENCILLNYVYIRNCNIGDYSALGNMGGRLRYLYFFNTTDSEIEKLCSNEKGIAKYELPNLQYFGIVGEESYFTTYSSFHYFYEGQKSANQITKIDEFENLNTVTKNAIKYMSLECNAITGVSALNGFNNIDSLRLESNSLKSLSGLENMKNLRRLCAANNLLGENESSSEKNSELDALKSLGNTTHLVELCLENNTHLVWIDYIKDCSELLYIDLFVCPNLNHSALAVISPVWFGCVQYKKINSDLVQYFVSEDVLSLQNLAEGSEKLLIIEEMSEASKSKVKQLDLSNSTLNNQKLNDIIVNFPNLESLNVNGCKSLTSLEFTKTANKLRILFFDNTGIVGDEVEKLDLYEPFIASVWCNEGANLTKMQKTISRCSYSPGTNYLFSDGGCCILRTDSLLEQLHNCTELTGLQLYGSKRSGAPTVLKLDLSNCSKLSSFGLQGMGYLEIILPTCIKQVGPYWYGDGTKIVTLAGKSSIDQIELRRKLVI